MMTQPELNGMPPVGRNDEIDLMAMWSVIVKRKKLILISMLGAALLSAVILLLMPNIYRAEVLLAPVNSKDSKSGLASALGGMGGLAAMAGLSLGGGGSTEESVAVLQSREFLWQFVQKKRLMPLLFEDVWDADKKRWKEDDPKDQPNQWDVYRLFIKENGLDVSVDKKTELVTVAVEWTDSALAASWANDIVSELNQYLARQAIDRSEKNLKYLNDELARTQIEEMRNVLFDMIASEQKSTMMANTQKEFAFKVLDPAAEPDKKVKPKRALIVILATFLAGLIAVGVVLFKDAAAQRREKYNAT